MGTPLGEKDGWGYPQCNGVLGITYGFPGTGKIVPIHIYKSKQPAIFCMCNSYLYLKTDAHNIFCLGCFGNLFGFPGVGRTVGILIFSGRQFDITWKLTPAGITRGYFTIIF